MCIKFQHLGHLLCFSAAVTVTTNWVCRILLVSCEMFILHYKYEQRMCKSYIAASESIAHDLKSVCTTNGRCGPINGEV